MRAETLQIIRDRKVAKGDVFEVSRLAGIMAAKKTADLIPLCHPLRLTNVEVHVSTAYDLPVPDDSIDRAFLITVLPEIPHQYLALDELRRVLKPGGLLSITEEFMDPDYAFPFETVQLVEAMGFTRERFYGNLWMYTLNFGKSEGIAYD